MGSIEHDVEAQREVLRRAWKNTSSGCGPPSANTAARSTRSFEIAGSGDGIDEELWAILEDEET